MFVSPNIKLTSVLENFGLEYVGWFSFYAQRLFVKIFDQCDYIYVHHAEIDKEDLLEILHCRRRHNIKENGEMLLYS